MLLEQSRTQAESTVAGMTPWLLLMQADLRSLPAESIITSRHRGRRYELKVGRLAAWVIAYWESGARMAFCVVNAMGHEIDLRERTAPYAEADGKRSATTVRLRSAIGEHAAVIELPTDGRDVLHWRTDYTPSVPILMPPAPYDVIPFDSALNPLNTHGIIHAKQLGIKGGVLYASVTRPSRGSLLYVQNFTSLTDYFATTHTSPADTVGGNWPELGFVLPGTGGAALQPRKRYTVSDAYVQLDKRVPDDELDAAEQFLDLYAGVYLAMPRPATLWRDWPRRVDETLRDLMHSPACSESLDGHKYLRAYVGSEGTPPESMVQLAVLIPLIEYAQWEGETIPLIEDLRRNIATFRDPALKAIVRHLPGHERMLEKSEEQTPCQMDSWYLYHTYHNVCRLAATGDAVAKKLLLDTIDYAINVAHHFDYRWPVFYDLRTLELIRREAEPGEGGENDVGAQYALLMLGVYDLTGDQRFLDEAKNAAKALRGLGFNLGYQFNNTAFGAGALLRLWKITGDDEFRRLSHVCIANIVRNLWLWECDYGVGEHYSTFMGLPPLRHAPYLALYEELESLAAFHAHLRHEGDGVLPSIRLLLAEYCKYLIHRAWYHYPSELPRSVLAEKTKEGHLNRHLSIPLEDLYDGWTRAGTVGQQVYGAAAPFVIATRHCFRVERAQLSVHCNYPTTPPEISGSKTTGQLRIRCLGDRRATCQFRVVPYDCNALPQIELRVHQTGSVEGRLTEFGFMEFDIAGDADLTLSWQRTDTAAAKPRKSTKRPRRPKSRKQEKS
jgi:hypothetical protein